MRDSFESCTLRADSGLPCAYQPTAMKIKLRTLMMDLRAWLMQLGVTVIECVFVGCDHADQRALVRVRTHSRPQKYDSLR